MSLMFKHATVVTFLILVCQYLVPIAYAQQPPNILLITCDNLGYGDLRVYNSESGQASSA